LAVGHGVVAEGDALDHLPADHPRDGTRAEGGHAEQDNPQERLPELLIFTKIYIGFHSKAAFWFQMRVV
ncbi:MAG: hypothetical protein Q8M07_20325, partial [Prosthecobacter sp.]|nr:hypothetical protein [Prosthecobacter sp.]